LFPIAFLTGVDLIALYDLSFTIMIIINRMRRKQFDVCFMSGNCHTRRALLSRPSQSELLVYVG